MRVPQRNFVVEFKSRSRQTKITKPTSIWGDTDLKAVARQVEEHSAHLFQRPTDESTADAIASSIEGSLPDLSPLEGPSLPREPNSPQADAETVAAAPTGIPPVKEIIDGQSVPSLRNVKARKTKPRALPSKHEDVPSAAPAVAQDMQEAFVSAAGLTALETENLRLKTLLRERLSTENTHLAAMLLRFL